MPTFFGNTNIPVTEAQVCVGAIWKLKRERLTCLLSRAGQQPKDAETASVETVIGSIADRRFAALNPHSAIEYVWRYRSYD